MYVFLQINVLKKWGTKEFKEDKGKSINVHVVQAAECQKAAPLAIKSSL